MGNSFSLPALTSLFFSCSHMQAALPDKPEPKQCNTGRSRSTKTNAAQAALAAGRGWESLGRAPLHTRTAQSTHAGHCEPCSVLDSPRADTERHISKALLGSPMLLGLYRVTGTYIYRVSTGGCVSYDHEHIPYTVLFFASSDLLYFPRIFQRAFI